MRALIIATGDPAVSEEIGERPPAFLLPLIDRPFLQHVVEFVAESRAFEAIDILLCHLPEKVEALFGDGTRWGVPITYHLVRDSSRPYAALRRIEADGPALLIHGDCLPQTQLKELAQGPGPMALCSNGEWTGWALLDAGSIGEIEAGWDRSQLSSFVLGSAYRRGAVQECPAVLGVRTDAEFIASQRTALDKGFAGLMFYGREVEEGIWIARNVSLHPTVTMIPPVYVGENSRVSKGMRLGPNVVVVRDCVLDSNTTVQDSTILPGSYVGQALELDHVIIDRNKLINVRAGGETLVSDDFILSGIARTSLRENLTNLLSRVTALLLLAVTSPVVLLTMIGLLILRRGPVFNPVVALRLPARENRWEWKTFRLISLVLPGSKPGMFQHLFLQVLPGLINVVRGHLHLVGVEPRNPEAALALPYDWRVLYLRARAGLITEAYALHGPNATADEIYSSEAFYSVAAGPRHDAAVLLRYLGRMLRMGRSALKSDWRGANLDLK